MSKKRINKNNQEKGYIKIYIKPIKKYKYIEKIKGIYLVVKNIFYLICKNKNKI